MHVLVFMLYEWYVFEKTSNFQRDEHEHEHKHEKKNTPIISKSGLFSDPSHCRRDRCSINDTREVLIGS